MHLIRVQVGGLHHACGAGERSHPHPSSSTMKRVARWRLVAQVARRSRAAPAAAAPESSSLSTRAPPGSPATASRRRHRRSSSCTTTFTTPGSPRTELSSTPTSVAPTDGGRTTRPWSMPGTRTLWTNSNVPVTIAGRSRRRTGVPETVHSPAGFRLRRAIEREVELLPPTSSP